MQVRGGAALGGEPGPFLRVTIRQADPMNRGVPIQMRQARGVTIALLLMPVAGLAQAPPQSSEPTVIYFVRHGEVEPASPTFPLSDAGKRRAGVFARTVADVDFTLVLSSHTTRARQMVEPVAHKRQLVVQQLPPPGTRLDGVVVSDSTPSRAAVGPLVEALLGVPQGSRILVGVNSDNIYAILHGLGVRSATAENPCMRGATCVPCLTNACFPGGEDQLWILVVAGGTKRPTLIELRYGATVP